MRKTSESNLDEIKCPKCGTMIPVSEALQHQIAEKIEAASQEKLEAKEAELLAREKDIQGKEKEVARGEKAISEKIEEGLRAAKKQLEQDLLEKARKEASLEMEDVKNQLAEKDDQLKKAQKSELELRKRERALEEKEKTMELETERRLSEERKKVEDDVAKRLSEQHRMKEAEKEKIINDLKIKLEEAQRQAEQGSQQLQGEVKELDLERLLKDVFPFDDSSPVAKGVRGADVVQTVKTKGGMVCGTILWEVKRTKAWSEGWVSKLKDDQREAKADVAVVVSDVVPKDIEHFGQRGTIWITKSAYVIGVAVLLRDALTAVARVRVMSESKDETVEILFRYITGPQFKQKVEAVVDAFVTMKSDLDKEKRSAMARWAKQEKNLEKALTSVASMHGDLRGLAGSSMQAIPLLESGEEMDEHETADESNLTSPPKKKKGAKL